MFVSAFVNLHTRDIEAGLRFYIDFGRGLIRFCRAKGGKTLEIALHPHASGAVRRYLEQGRPALVGAGAQDDEPRPND